MAVAQCSDDDRPTLRDFAPAGGILALLLALLVAAAVMQAADSGRYLVVAGRGMGLGETVTLVQRSHGRLIGAGALPNSLVVDSAAPDFASSMRKAGAWMVIGTSARAACEGN